MHFFQRRRKNIQFGTGGDAGEYSTYVARACDFIMTGNLHKFSLRKFHVIFFIIKILLYFKKIF
jgi:hypothetical protein